MLSSLIKSKLNDEVFGLKAEFHFIKPEKSERWGIKMESFLYSNRVWPLNGESCLRLNRTSGARPVLFPQNQTLEQQTVDTEPLFAAQTSLLHTWVNELFRSSSTAQSC